MERNVVGSRELKVRLGAYVRRVRQGQTLIITDRGEPENTRDAILAKLEPAVP